MSYSTTFAAGTLLREETLRVLETVEQGATLDDVEPDVLDINSRAGRERRFHEVKRRLENVDPSVWDDFLRCTPTQQQVVLYYTCVKTYDLVADIHMHAVLSAWRSITQELHRSDIQRFLDEQMTTHPEIAEWSESTPESSSTPGCRQTASISTAHQRIGGTSAYSDPWTSTCEDVLSTTARVWAISCRGDNRRACSPTLLIPDVTRRGLSARSGALHSSISQQTG